MKVRLFGEEQLAQWPCWLVVGFGAGIATYFALPIEPEVWVGILIAGILAANWHWGHYSIIRALLLFLIFVALGFQASSLRTWLIAAPQLERPLYAAQIHGRIADIEHLTKGFRLTLEELSIKNLPTKETPKKIRVKFWKLSSEFAPGDRIYLSASLQPLGRPAIAGAFDFRRDAFFRGLGATGFAYKEPVMIEKSNGFSLRTVFSTLSHQITARVLQVVPGSAGAFMVALLTGDQSVLAQRDIKAMRDSGLAHLLSVSGLHIGMVFGLLFATLRGLLALFPKWALNYPIKKWALFPAFAGACFYAFVAGLPVPTERSLIMVGVAGLAILLDRPVFSLRMVAAAAFFVLAFNPEALVGPSFQLSFSAVTALVATYEFFNKSNFLRRKRKAGFGKRIMHWVVGTIIASMVATLATAPFAIYHFNRTALYGVVANIIGIPLTGFIVMPAGVVALILMPLGLDAPFLKIMEFGSSLTLYLAHFIQSLPVSVLIIPAMPIAGLFLSSTGLFCLFFLVKKPRLSGIVFYIAGFISIIFVATPDFIVSEDGKLFAAKAADGTLYLSNIRNNKLNAETWLRRNGQISADTIVGMKDIRCDPLGCQITRQGKTIAIGYNEDALLDDCANADLVINLEPIREGCTDQWVDRFTLWREGSQAFYFEDGKIHIEPVAGENNRPWQAQRFKPRPRPPGPFKE